MREHKDDCTAESAEGIIMEFNVVDISHHPTLLSATELRVLRVSAVAFPIFGDQA